MKTLNDILELYRLYLNRELTGHEIYTISRLAMPHAICINDSQVEENQKSIQAYYDNIMHKGNYLFKPNRTMKEITNIEHPEILAGYVIKEGIKISLGINSIDDINNLIKFLEASKPIFSK